MKRRLTFAPALFVMSLALVSLTGCVFNVGASEGKVVERSKKERPAWAALAPDELHDSEQKLSYVSVRSDIRDLPLGIKQTQLGAVSAGQMALHKIFRDRVRDAAVKSSIGPLPAGELDQAIKAAFEQHQVGGSEVADIYYEKFEVDAPAAGGAPTFYRVYVLMNYGKADLRLVDQALVGVLKRSRNPELRRVGLVLGSYPFKI